MMQIFGALHHCQLDLWKFAVKEELGSELWEILF